MRSPRVTSHSNSNHSGVSLGSVYKLHNAHKGAREGVMPQASKTPSCPHGLQPKQYLLLCRRLMIAVRSSNDTAHAFANMCVYVSARCRHTQHNRYQPVATKVLDHHAELQEWTIILGSSRPSSRRTALGRVLGTQLRLFWVRPTFHR